MESFDPSPGSTPGTYILLYCAIIISVVLHTHPDYEWIHDTVVVTTYATICVDDYMLLQIYHCLRFNIGSKLLEEDAKTMR